MRSSQQLYNLLLDFLLHDLRSYSCSVTFYVGIPTGYFDAPVSVRCSERPRVKSEVVAITNNQIQPLGLC